MIRSFIAIDLPAPIRQRLQRISDYLQTQTPSKALKWVAAENMHLTLKFLGQLPETTLEQVKSILPSAMDGVAPFDLTIKNLGMYPTAEKPRVVWLGIENTGALSRIHTRIESAFHAVSIQPDSRPFSAHLTIARLRRNVDRDTAYQVGQTLSQFKAPALGPFEVNAIHLYRSRLTPQGPIYTPLFSCLLNTV